MKFTSPVDTDHYPNLPMLEKIINEWNPPHVEGEVLLLPSPDFPDSVCLLFKGSVRGKQVPPATWSASQVIFTYPELVKAMERVLEEFLEFLESTLGMGHHSDGRANESEG